jgi:hypothetical protein
MLAAVEQDTPCFCSTIPCMSLAPRMHDCVQHCNNARHADVTICSMWCTLSTWYVTNTVDDLPCMHVRARTSKAALLAARSSSDSALSFLAYRLIAFSTVSFGSSSCDAITARSSLVSSANGSSATCVLASSTSLRCCVHSAKIDEVYIPHRTAFRCNQ